MGLSSLGVVMVIAMPFVIRAQWHYRLSALGMEAAAAKLITRDLEAQAPALLFSLLLSVAGVCVGRGLFRQREWALRGWIVLCAIWSSGGFIAVLVAPEVMSAARLVFQIVVLVASLDILRQHATRSACFKEESRAAQSQIPRSRET